MDLLLIFACFYFAYSQIMSLVNYGSQPWELVHYLLLLLSIALIAMGGWRSVLYYRQWKYKKEHPDEENTVAQLPDSEEEAEEPVETESEPEEKAPTQPQG